MHLKNILVALLAAVLLAGLGWTLLSSDAGEGPAFVSWDAGDVEPLADEEIPPDPLEAELAAHGLERVALEAVEVPASSDPREVGVRGRVLDSYGRALAGAQVVLEIGGGRGRRGGRNRIRTPVETSADGHFQFRGQAVPGASISLHLTHPEHAPEIVDRKFEDGAVELDVGDLPMLAGGSLVGSIVNADGVGIPGATAQISPRGRNRLNWSRNRRDLLKPVETDRNGFFRVRHLRPGDYRIDASAPNHTRASSDVITLANLDEQELEPIVLGPGYQITGSVFSADGKPVEGAELTLSPGRAGRQRSDEQGRFLFDHLPARPVNLKVTAKGYVSYNQADIEPKDSTPLVVRLQDGLTITGVVSDRRTGSPVTAYAARARRVGQLPEKDQASRVAKMRQDMERLEHMMVELARREAEGARDDNAREQLLKQREQLQVLRDKSRALMTMMRQTEANPGRERGRRNGRGGSSPGRAGEVQEHPGGEFSFGGLDEGVYVVDLESPDHQRHRTDPVELRLGGANPHLVVALERGLHVTGVVTARHTGQPLADVTVELMAPPERSSGGRTGAAQQFFQSYRGRGRGNAVVRARTDGQGRYQLRHAPPGRYLVSARGSGLAESRSDEFELRTDIDQLDFELGKLAVLRGVVQGIPDGKHGEVRVMAFGGPGNIKNGRVKSDGSYELDQLVPGGYVVRAHLGSMRSFLSRELRTLMVGAQEGTTTFDLTLAEGDEKNFDPALSIPPVGEVVGSIVHNGLPGKDLQVSLRAVEANGGSTPGQSREGGRWRFLGGSFRNQTRTNQNGEFTFRDVPEGAYQLVVNSGRNRRQQLLAQDVYVRRDSRNEQRLSVFTAALEGEVHAADGTPARDLDGNIRLYAGVRERPADPREFARHSTMHTVRVRDGRFEGLEIETGEYLLELSLRGRERVEQPLSVGAGTRHLRLTAGAKRE